MKMSARNVEMTCTLVLSERESKMLGWLAGFGAENIAKAILHGVDQRIHKTGMGKSLARIPLRAGINVQPLRKRSRRIHRSETSGRPRAGRRESRRMMTWYDPKLDAERTDYDTNVESDGRCEREEKSVIIDTQFNTGFMLGVEFGYKQCEKGHNIQKAFSEARNVLKK
jgi:hypothetical protein